MTGSWFWPAARPAVELVIDSNLNKYSPYVFCFDSLKDRLSMGAGTNKNFKSSKRSLIVNKFLRSCQLLLFFDF